LKRGLPRKLYVDNGPAFRSQHLAQITASLGIALIHSRPYQPECGKGDILYSPCQEKKLDLQ
jgi:putative transposase